MVNARIDARTLRLTSELVDLRVEHANPCTTSCAEFESYILSAIK